MKPRPPTFHHADLERKPPLVMTRKKYTHRGCRKCGKDWIDVTHNSKECKPTCETAERPVGLS